MYLIRFCFGYIVFLLVVIILQLIPSVDPFFFEKPSKNAASPPNPHPTPFSKNDSKEQAA